MTTKKAYVKPAMMANTLETENIIAASGKITVEVVGGNDGPLNPSCTTGGNISQVTTTQSLTFPVNDGNCVDKWVKLGFKKGDIVNISLKTDNGGWNRGNVYTVTYMGHTSN